MGNRKKIALISISVVIVIILIIIFASLSIKLGEKDGEDDSDGKNIREINYYFTTPEEERAINISEYLDSPSYLGEFIHEDLPVRNVTDYLESYNECYNNIKENHTDRYSIIRYRVFSRSFSRCQFRISKSAGLQDEFGNDWPFSFLINASFDKNYSEGDEFFNARFARKWSKIGYRSNGAWEIRGGNDDKDDLFVKLNFSNVYILEHHIYYAQGDQLWGGITFWITQYVVMNSEYEPIFISQTYSQADD